MTRLSGMMLEELERRNYSARTTRCDLRAEADFARCFDRIPDQLSPAHMQGKKDSLRDVGARGLAEPKSDPTTLGGPAARRMPAAEQRG